MRLKMPPAFNHDATIDISQTSLLLRLLQKCQSEARAKKTSLMEQAQAYGLNHVATLAVQKAAKPSKIPRGGHLACGLRQVRSKGASAQQGVGTCSTTRVGANIGPDASLLSCPAAKQRRDAGGAGELGGAAASRARACTPTLAPAM